MILGRTPGRSEQLGEHLGSREKLGETLGGRERLGEIPAEDEILAEYLGHAGEILASKTTSRSDKKSISGLLSEGAVPSEKATRKRVNTDPEVVKKRKSSKTEEYGNEDDAEETESEMSAER